LNRAAGIKPSCPYGQFGWASGRVVQATARENSRRVSHKGKTDGRRSFRQVLARNSAQYTQQCCAAPWGCWRSNFCRVSVLTALFQDQLTHHLTAGDRAAVRERACFFTENPATRKRIPVTRHCNHAADRQSDDARRRPLRACHPPPSLPIRPAHDAVFRRAAARPRH